MQNKSVSASFSPDKRWSTKPATSCPLKGLTVKSFFDFIGRTETEMWRRLPRNAETGGSGKEALFASAAGGEVSEFLGAAARQAS